MVNNLYLKKKNVLRVSSFDSVNCPAYRPLVIMNVPRVPIGRPLDPNCIFVYFKAFVFDSSGVSVAQNDPSGLRAPGENDCRSRDLVSGFIWSRSPVQLRRLFPIGLGLRNPPPGLFCLRVTVTFLAVTTNPGRIWSRGEQHGGRRENSGLTVGLQLGAFNWGASSIPQITHILCGRFFTCELQSVFGLQASYLINLPLKPFH